MEQADKPEKKLTIFITIDTEDAYFTTPRLITGEGLPEQPGIGKIMDIMDHHCVKGNFFLDVYDVKYDPALLQKIARNIHLRGHEVELHTHPSGNLPFYSKPIYRYSLREQIDILEYGKKFIAEHTGSSPIAHRGGSYAINENTLYALSEIGLPIDSSVFHQHPNNNLGEIPTTNKTISYYNTIEIPVTYVKIISKTGELLKSKFDLDWLSYDELVKVIQLAKAHGLRKMTLFLHSFSFINKKTKPAAAPENPSALYRDKSSGGTVYCEIYGTDYADISSFDRLLHYMTSDPEIEVTTFKDWYARNKNEAPGEDFIPVIDRLIKS
ncbi:polysaccharide deacetylase family protein [Paenibacillus donghaensis]|uniref:NodB homology domain-containing protein n=1 Tax=Paenibacillus donghaensis TaxID=414771 RepID=A0A2Z2KGG6_9BACL|nr:polysaccharide deacetylase family protein [Paenibacillus donghaensis]ASA21249.1 hypothetical protein B9T62_10905 [Paenibacillus donghaensis]